MPAPVITSVVPGGATRGATGTLITVTGANFGASQGTGGVTIGGVAAIIASWADTSITCRADDDPETPLGAQDLVVTADGAGGTDTETGAVYVYLASTYPTGADLITYLASVGTLGAGDAARWINAAITAWEEVTGWMPFLTSAASLRRFDPPGSDRTGRWRGDGLTLDLRGGLTSVTSIYSGYTGVGTGVLLAAGTDYYLAPSDAAGRSWPYERIEFANPQAGDPQSIAVTAKWGFCDALPDAAWVAVRDYAASRAMPQMEIARSQGGLVEWATEGLRLRFAEAGKAQAPWVVGWRSAVYAYRRVVM